MSLPGGIGGAHPASELAADADGQAALAFVRARVPQLATA